VALLEVKKNLDGKVLARRTDGRPLTPRDREEARRMIQTAKAPAKHQTDEVARILAIWRGLGIKDLDGRRADDGREPVGEHLANLRSWQSKWGSRDGRE